MKKKKAQKENGERWLLTYSDLITLLMIFFVVLYASSNVDAQKFNQLSSSFKEGFGTAGENVIAIPGLPIPEGNVEPTPIISEEQKLDALKSKIDSSINGSNLSANVSTSIEERGLVISFENEILFDIGDASLKDNHKNELLTLCKILNEMPNFIRIEGHTDNIPISTAKFSSNWQLSCGRASNVAQFISDSGFLSPNRISALGYGEYRPIDTNSTASGRAKNRRVDIVVLNSKFNESEGNK
ncbi:MAG: flagellar motor protein MotB [Clostridium sp.]